MPIEEHPFHLYEQSLEIFPERISNDQYVVYHGTSILNSARIEADGFQIGIAPFDIMAAIELVNLLRRPEFVLYDRPCVLGNTTASGLEHYLSYIQGDEAKISFSNLSFAATSFASGELKGGQAQHYIGEARLILHEAVFKNTALINLIPDSVQQILNNYEDVQNNIGVVYAIKIPQTLENFTLQNSVVFATATVPVDLIIAKVFVHGRSDIQMKIVNSKLKSKLEKNTIPVGLGILFGRQDDDYGDINIIEPID